MKKERGVVLLNVLMLSLMMALIVSALLKLSFGRRVMVAQHRASYTAKTVSESLLPMIQACLLYTTYPPTGTCSYPAGTGTWSSWGPGCGGGCYKMTITGYPVGGGSHPVEIDWYDPSGGNDAQLVITCGSATDGCLDFM